MPKHNVGRFSRRYKGVNHTEIDINDRTNLETFEKFPSNSGTFLDNVVTHFSEHKGSEVASCTTPVSMFLNVKSHCRFHLQWLFIAQA